MNFKIIELTFEGKYKEIRFITELFAFKLTEKGRCISPLHYWDDSTKKSLVVNLENYKFIYNKLGVEINELL